MSTWLSWLGKLVRSGGEGCPKLGSDGEEDFSWSDPVISCRNVELTGVECGVGCTVSTTGGVGRSWISGFSPGSQVIGAGGSVMAGEGWRAVPRVGVRPLLRRREDAALAPLPGGMARSDG